MVLIAAAGVALVALATWLIWKRGATRIQQDHPVVEVKPQAEVMPQKIAALDADDQEVMSVTVLEESEGILVNLEERDDVVPLPVDALSRGLSRLVAPLCQVAPATATAVQANSSKLMEVVINGQMLAAADGEGLRAIAKAGKGFEHARLYEPKNLQNIANAAAAWQIASVVVAQKHMADITAELKKIDAKVGEIQAQQEEGRRAVVTSARDYLEQARLAFQSGEFNARTRMKLEDLDIELHRVFLELAGQIRRELARPVSRDLVGCKGPYVEALAKHRKLKELVAELVLCSDVRLANWYMCSLYQDKSQMLAPRMEQIQSQMREMEELRIAISGAAEADLELIRAKMTTRKTEQKRRSEVQEVSTAAVLPLMQAKDHQQRVIQRLQEISISTTRPQRLLVSVVDGKPMQVGLLSDARKSIEVHDNVS